MGNVRLHDTVAFYDPPDASAEPGLIERMCHGADQAARDTSRQTRVCVERDDVPHTRRSLHWTSTDRKKRSVDSAAQKLVQLPELSSLALPSHPFALALVPDTLSVQQQEALAAVGSGAMDLVQPRNTVNCDGEQFVIARKALACCVHPVREIGRAS